jgi:fibronectin type III domain protein
MATVPPAPGVFRILSYTNVRVDGDVNGGGGTGGSPILQHQVAWGTSPNVPGNGGGFGNLDISTGGGFITGLAPGVNYYFWNRLRNAIGFGPWSPRNDVRMKDRPDPTDYPRMSAKTQTTGILSISPNWDGDSVITGYRLSWGTSPNVPQFTKDSVGPLFTLANLSPGLMYYFWGQAANTYGISDYSPRSAAQMIAGAYFKVGLVWHKAVPYVKVAGVWRVARPWGKLSGFWYETPE